MRAVISDDWIRGMRIHRLARRRATMSTRRRARFDAGMRAGILFVIVFACVGTVRASPPTTAGRAPRASLSTVRPREHDDAPARVVVPFEPCGGGGGGADADAFCATIGVGCEITDAAATAGRDGATMTEDGCVVVLGGEKDGVARLAVSRTCAGRAVWIRATMTCEEGEGRLFPYSTMLLGEVIALADAAIYLANSTHALKETIRGNETTTEDDDAGEEEEDRRGASFTIYYPWSY
jgi:hypothetical protein